MKDLLIRYLKYAGTSVVGSIVDTLVLWLISTFIFKGGYVREYIISPFISFQCAVAVNFTISFFYVWKDRTRSAGNHHFLRLYLMYNLSNTLVFLFRLGVLLLICNMAAMLFSGLLNFALDNLVIFKKKIN